MRVGGADLEVVIRDLGARAAATRQKPHQDREPREEPLDDAAGQAVAKAQRIEPRDQADPTEAVSVVHRRDADRAHAEELDAAEVRTEDTLELGGLVFVEVVRVLAV